jgi:CDP-glucose 4,6-dehydratase
MTGRLGFYEGKRVFLTGHTGFKGAWLALWLTRLGARVTGYALPAEARSLFVAAGVESRIDSRIGDVRDLPALRTALKDAAPDIVFHLAAQSLVRLSYEEPVETFDTNVMGTVNLLEAMRSTDGIAAGVIVTSDKCYENDGRGHPYGEDAAMGGHDPYSASKGCTELVTSAFARSFFHEGGTSIASARAGNVIGGGDWAKDRIIPDLMRAAETGEPAFIRRPEAVRPWQHVLEPLRGYLLLGAALANDGQRFSGGWNFGPDESDTAPVRRIVDLAKRTWSAVEADIADVETGPHEAALLRLDSTKAKTKLGWRPLFGLEDAVATTVDWYSQAHARPGRVAQYTETQLDQYADLSDTADLEYFR